VTNTQSLKALADHGDGCQASTLLYGDKQTL